MAFGCFVLVLVSSGTRWFDKKGAEVACLVENQPLVDLIDSSLAGMLIDSIFCRGYVSAPLSFRVGISFGDFTLFPPSRTIGRAIKINSRGNVVRRIILAHLYRIVDFYPREMEQNCYLLDYLLQPLQTPRWFTLAVVSLHNSGTFDFNPSQTQIQSVRRRQLARASLSPLIRDRIQSRVNEYLIFLSFSFFFSFFFFNRITSAENGEPNRVGIVSATRSVMYVSLRMFHFDSFEKRVIDRLPLIRDRGSREKVDEITRDTSGN